MAHLPPGTCHAQAHTHTLNHHCNYPQPAPGGRVPLAVWATTNTEQTPGLSTPNWLTQLLTEYARPDGRTVMLTDTGDPHPPYPPARPAANNPRRQTWSLSWHTYAGHHTTTSDPGY